MSESLRMIATAAPGTFQVPRAAFTYASNPGNGSFCCAVTGSADETNPIAAIARALVRLMKVSENECRVGRISVCQYGIPFTPAPVRHALHRCSSILRKRWNSDETDLRNGDRPDRSV